MSQLSSQGGGAPEFVIARGVIEIVPNTQKWDEFIKSAERQLDNLIERAASIMQDVKAAQGPPATAPAAFSRRDIDDASRSAIDDSKQDRIVDAAEQIAGDTTTIIGILQQIQENG